MVAAKLEALPIGFETATAVSNEIRNLQITLLSPKVSAAANSFEETFFTFINETMISHGIQIALGSLRRSNESVENKERPVLKISSKHTS